MSKRSGIAFLFVLFTGLLVVAPALAQQVDWKNTTLVVSADRLNVRAAPSGSSQVIGSVSRGQKLKPLSKQGSWYEIEYKGGTGWVAASYVTEESVAPSGEEQEPQTKPAEEPKAEENLKTDQQPVDSYKIGIAPKLGIMSFVLAPRPGLYVSAEGRFRFEKPNGLLLTPQLEYMLVGLDNVVGLEMDAGWEFAVNWSLKPYVVAGLGIFRDFYAGQSSILFAGTAAAGFRKPFRTGSLLVELRFTYFGQSAVVGILNAGYLFDL